MHTGDALLRACFENPDDDTPRLAYADWLDENGDPDRAEFIRVQLELERGQSDDARARLRDREKELLAADEREWLGLPPHLTELSQYTWFERGMIVQTGVATDEEAEAVARCRMLRQLGIGGEGITDVGLAH